MNYLLLLFFLLLLLLLLLLLILFFLVWPLAVFRSFHMFFQRRSSYVGMAACTEVASCIEAVRLMEFDGGRA